MESIRRVAVLGSGSWGTAFAKVIADAGRDVVLWSRRQTVAEEITRLHRNSDYLPDVTLPTNLTATSDAAEALAGADAVVLAVPSQTLRTNLASWRPLLPAGATLVSTAKGVELGSLKRMSEVIAEVAEVPADQVAVVSGPNLAKEVGAEQPTATVIACTDVQRAEALQHACSTRYFRPYTNVDVIGCELGGACKNVIGLACGMADGLGFGDNTTATLITRGLAETARLGAALGADPLTFAGLAGLGDLVATCSSPLSRNRTFGARIGRGDSIAQAQAAANGQVAEGVKSCASIRELGARHGVEMPITDSVYRVCHEALSPRVMAAELLGRARKAEWS
ncbi:glycerol-3-phosphate dehydrogenase (NAD(P)+) [Actinoalloteichus hoggarensis]|uniref:Glycerol-3-phosphate dehydrogenase [NAD(P)+] n=1 Tax=Actinoalloteichus hoggarensis TaxID=1470176 RepID=A0A221W8K6_9PSEU|nr:NAD(P)H-dependent glycerol-3-phosphate dehydrogenase [Actinoalloteichus hoggarensis]ASO22350.1 Glycerol-3-phosphate dehydrogenase [NAD(P)+] [Actinoalloteichus hoggarensis]MBB5923228.1 glycerol-3-phosphate dehydrogenase (NAD(P)+) [Actinoalloteichus hoggarensis]